jgi:hypothetical protein
MGTVHQVHKDALQCHRLPVQHRFDARHIAPSMAFKCRLVSLVSSLKSTSSNCCFPNLWMVVDTVTAGFSAHQLATFLLRSMSEGALLFASRPVFLPARFSLLPLASAL